MNNWTKFAALRMKFSNIKKTTGPQAADPPSGRFFFLQTLKVAYFSFTNRYFSFLSLVGSPMKNCAKYQHPKQKFSIFKKNPKIAFFTFFEGLKKRAL